MDNEAEDESPKSHGERQAHKYIPLLFLGIAFVC